MFKFYLDGSLLTYQPEGWKDLITSIARDKSVKGVLQTVDASLEFIGDGYTALKSAFDSGFCEAVTLKIYQTTNGQDYLIHDGLIHLSDCEWNLNKQIVKAKVEDNSWYSRIGNNKGLEATLNTSTSKNGETIQAASPFALTMHKQSDGTDYVDTRSAYKVYDVLRFLVDYMTDGQVDFASDCFDTGGQYEGYCIMTGFEATNHNGAVIPRLSFTQAFTELNKKFNLGFTIENGLSAPTLRIEPFDYFYQSDISYALPIPPLEPTKKVNTRDLYSAVRLGSTKTARENALSFPDVQPLISFKEEQYTVTGECNIDRELDLVSDWIISTAVIEVLTENLSGAEDYEEDIVIINYDPATDTTVQSDWASTGFFLYNETLNNANTVQRLYGMIPNTLAAYFADPTSDRATAYRSSDDVQNLYLVPNNTNTIQVLFDNDYTGIGNDTNNNYGNGTTQGNPVSRINSIYTAPSAGRYSFVTVNKVLAGTVNAVISDATFAAAGVRVRIKFTHRDSGNSILGEYYSSYVPIPTRNNLYTLVGSLTIYMDSTDFVEVGFDINRQSGTGAWTYMGFTLKGGQDNYFKCTSIDTGGVVGGGDINEYPVINYKFNIDLKLFELQFIQQLPLGQLQFELQDGTELTGWIESIKYNHYEGNADITLVTNATNAN